MNNYKIYAENHPALQDRSADDYLWRIGPKSYLNASGAIFLTVEDLFKMDPRAALIIYLFSFIHATRFEHSDVLVAMQEAFDDVIDFIHGGVTLAGYNRFAYYSHFVGCTVATHRSWVQYERVKNDPIARAAWPTGTIANLGGRPQTADNSVESQGESAP